MNRFSVQEKDQYLCDGTWHRWRLTQCYKKKVTTFPPYERLSGLSKNRNNNNAQETVEEFILFHTVTPQW